MDKKQIVNKLKTKLNEVGLPQAWAARQVGVTPAYFNRVVTSGMNPSDDLSERMSTLLAKLNSSGLTRAV